MSTDPRIELLAKKMAMLQHKPSTHYRCAASIVLDELDAIQAEADVEAGIRRVRIVRDLFAEAEAAGVDGLTLEASGRIQADGATFPEVTKKQRVVVIEDAD